MRTKAHNQSRFMRIITVPFRVLGKARDLYVRSLAGCADRVSYCDNMAMGGQFSLPKSFSVSSSRSNDSEDFTELIRAASARNLGKRIDMDMIMQQQVRQSGAVGNIGLPKSCSVGMGKIDEDRPCEFAEDVVSHAKAADLLYPRSRSYAVTKRSVVF